MYKKVLGCLLGAAAGDAMGAATDTRNRSQIEKLIVGICDRIFNAAGGYICERKQGRAGYR